MFGNSELHACSLKQENFDQINCAVFWHMDCVFTLEWNETPHCWIDTIELIWLKCKTTARRGIVGIVCLQWASLAQKVCLPDGVTDLNVYLLSFCQRYVTPGCLLTRYILILSHMLLFQCDVPLQWVAIWLVGFFLFLSSIAKLPWVEAVNQSIHHRWHLPVTHRGSQQNAVNSTLRKVLRARAPLKEFGVGMGDSMIPIIVCDKVKKSVCKALVMSFLLGKSVTLHVLCWYWAFSFPFF